MRNYESGIRNKEFKKGFTLVELLVSMAVFVIFLGVVSTSYVGIVRSQRQANAVRKMYSEVRTLMDTMSSDMRLGSPDYDCYEASSDVNKCPAEVKNKLQLEADGSSIYLALVNKDNTEKTFYWFDPTAQKLKLKKFSIANGAWAAEADYVDQLDEGFKPLLADDIKITNLTFMIAPIVNPYSHAHYDQSQFQFQPKVTVLLSVENLNSTLPPFHLDLQTTISSRVYSLQS